MDSTHPREHGVRIQYNRRDEEVRVDGLMLRETPMVVMQELTTGVGSKDAEQQAWRYDNGKRVK